MVLDNYEKKFEMRLNVVRDMLLGGLGWFDMY